MNALDEIRGVAGGGQAIDSGVQGRQILSFSQGIAGANAHQGRHEIQFGRPAAFDQALLSPEATEESSASNGNGSLGGMSTLISALQKATEGHLSQRRSR